MGDSLDGLSNKLIATFGSGESEHNWERTDTLLKEFTNALPSAKADDIISTVRKIKDVLLGAVRFRFSSHVMLIALI